MGYFGLTGGVASGKSTVARMFEELGAKVIDADRIGHELLGSTQPPYNEIVRRFGKEVLDASGEIDRRRLGAIVFSDAAKLRELNAILHPRIIERVEAEAQRYRAQDPRAVILVDAALIFEAGIGSRFEKLLVAWCPPEMQIERLMAKAGLSRKKAEQRVAAQIPSDEKRRRADYVIDSSGSLEDTRKQVERLFLELRRIVVGN
jgi:dephospho-CoA kinase